MGGHKSPCPLVSAGYVLLCLLQESRPFLCFFYLIKQVFVLLLFFFQLGFQSLALFFVSVVQICLDHVQLHELSHVVLLVFGRHHSFLHQLHSFGFAVAQAFHNSPHQHFQECLTRYWFALILHEVLDVCLAGIKESVLGQEANDSVTQQSYKLIYFCIDCLSEPVN